MALSTRFVVDSAADTDTWIRAVHTGFLSPPALTQESLDERRARQDFRRARGVFDGDRCVATFRSFDQRLTVVGGATVAANAVSAVTVTATHRRRGLLSGLMATDLAEAKERGDAVATLVAAEYPIYGRFGFGPATMVTTWHVDGARTGLDPRWALPESEGTLAFVDGAEVREAGPGVHERFRLGQAGAIDRNPLFWERATGEARFDITPWQEPFHVLYRDADGVPQGLVTFSVDDRWDAGRPANTASVRDLFATSPAVEATLWRFLLSLDWVMTVDTGRTGPDSPLTLLLPDARAAVVHQHADFLWLRPLDIPRMLAARRYAAEGELVFDVRDPLGLAGGRFLLDASPQGASCAPTGREPDLTLDTGALSRMYLGDSSAARLATSGWIGEETTGAVARADLLFRTGHRPWCPDIF
ncbi:GNAT family N-acetyltransferase [Streptomyces sp. NBC_01803]|uniref:GNAT family N-acetyltransferase n=1 Tax=Streptomyces sp. NBC_01803 TaxID=2975946 RepID=UPI002DDAF7E5|nr:GNAT family N-acetyltransferase [Streptomyces sp. NBC_01803]WSA44868.1 GNAT family N-acetyltransferase [Streptomyces sp. NBC_01803]